MVKQSGSHVLRHPTETLKSSQTLHLVWSRKCIAIGVTRRPFTLVNHSLTFRWGGTVGGVMTELCYISFLLVLLSFSVVVGWITGVHERV